MAKDSYDRDTDIDVESLIKGMNSQTKAYKAESKETNTSLDKIRENIADIKKLAEVFTKEMKKIEKEFKDSAKDQKDMADYLKDIKKMYEDDKKKRGAQSKKKATVNDWKNPNIGGKQKSPWKESDIDMVRKLVNKGLTKGSIQVNDDHGGQKAHQTNVLLAGIGGYLKNIGRALMGSRGAADTHGSRGDTGMGSRIGAASGTTAPAGGDPIGGLLRAQSRLRNSMKNYNTSILIGSKNWDALREKVSYFVKIQKQLVESGEIEKEQYSEKLNAINDLLIIQSQLKPKEKAIVDEAIKRLSVAKLETGEFEKQLEIASKLGDKYREVARQRTLKESFADKWKQVTEGITDLADKAQSLAAATAGVEKFDRFAVWVEGLKDGAKYTKDMSNRLYEVNGTVGDITKKGAEGNSMYQHGADIQARYLETGQLQEEQQKARLNNLTRGIRDEKTLNRVTGIGLSTAKLIGSNAESTSETMADWNQHLGLSITETAMLGRNLINIARTTGVTGDILMQSAKSTEDIAKSMRFAGTYTSEAHRQLIAFNAAAKKGGVGDIADKMSKALTSMADFQESAPDMQRFLLNSANASGNSRLIGNVMTGTAQNDKSKQALAEGIGNVIKTYTEGKSFEEWQKLSESDNDNDRVRAQIMNTNFREMYKMDIGAAAALQKSLQESLKKAPGETGKKMTDAELAAQQQKDISTKLNDLGPLLKVETLHNKYLLEIKQAIDKKRNTALDEIGPKAFFETNITAGDIKLVITAINGATTAIYSLIAAVGVFSLVKSGIGGLLAKLGLGGTGGGLLGKLLGKGGSGGLGSLGGGALGFGAGRLMNSMFGDDIEQWGEETLGLGKTARATANGLTTFGTTLLMTGNPFIAALAAGASILKDWDNAMAENAEEIKKRTIQIEQERDAAANKLKETTKGNRTSEFANDIVEKTNQIKVKEAESKASDARSQQDALRDTIKEREGSNWEAAKTGLSGAASKFGLGGWQAERKAEEAEQKATASRADYQARSENAEAQLRKSQESLTGKVSAEKLANAAGLASGTKSIGEVLGRKDLMGRSLPELLNNIKEIEKDPSWLANDPTGQKKQGYEQQKQLARTVAEWSQKEYGYDITTQEKLSSMAELATKKGSIYTHDIHLEKLLLGRMAKADSGPLSDTEFAIRRSQADLNETPTTGAVRESMESMDAIEENTARTNEHLEDVVDKLQDLINVLMGDSNVIGPGNTAANIKPKTPSNFWSWSIPAIGPGPSAGDINPTPAI